MGRTESYSIQVHPRDEQNQINLMQKFRWNLLSSQEIKTVDSHLEKRGDAIYSIKESEHYIKLVFQRDLDTPNLVKIKKLEKEYFSREYPPKPGVLKPIPVSLLVALIAGLIIEAIAGEGIVVIASMIIIVGIGIFITYKNIKRRKELTELYAENDRIRSKIIADCDSLE